MAKKSIHVDHWFYSEPDMKPNKDGRRELVAKACFGPLEVYAWGIDLNGRPYKEYKWAETYETVRKELLQLAQK